MFKSWCNHHNKLVHLKLLGSGSMTISYLVLSFASLFFFYNFLFIVTTTYSWFYNTLQIIRYLSNPQYYFEVNDHSFVLILCFLCCQGHALDEKNWDNRWWIIIRLQYMIFQMESFAGYSTYSCLKLHSTHWEMETCHCLILLLMVDTLLLQSRSSCLQVLCPLISFMQSHCGNAFVWECSSSRSWREFWSLRWQVLRSIQASATISCYLFLLPTSHCSVGLEMLVFRRLFLVQSYAISVAALI